MNVNVHDIVDMILSLASWLLHSIKIILSHINIIVALILTNFLKKERKGYYKRNNELRPDYEINFNTANFLSRHS